MSGFSFSTGVQTLASESMPIFAGIVMCKIVCEVTGRISTSHFKSYANLSDKQRVEWKNRGFSTFHALLAAAVSFHLLTFSDLFRGGSYNDLVINRHSTVSDTMLGVSTGYFLADLGMIFWCFPDLGGKEYVLHHCLSMYSILLSLMSGQGQIYILMVLFTEVTTPFVNLRWYLDVAGQKNSNLYVYNGIALFFGWLVARVLLFIFFFTHMYLNFGQVNFSVLQKARTREAFFF